MAKINKKEEVEINDIKQAVGNIQNKVNEQMENARDEIHAHPLAYVALAAGVGLAAGYLIKSMKKDECRCD